MSPRPLASEPLRETPYMDAHEAAPYLHYASTRTLYQAIRNDVRNGRNEPIPVCYRGRTLLFDKRDLDAWLHVPTVNRDGRTDKTNKVATLVSR